MTQAEIAEKMIKNAWGGALRRTWEQNQRADAAAGYGYCKGVFEYGDGSLLVEHPKEVVLAFPNRQAFAEWRQANKVKDADRHGTPPQANERVRLKEEA